MEQKKLKILVVDDKWNMRNLIKMYLNRQDWLVTEASDGKEALELMRFYGDNVHLNHKKRK